MPGRVSPVKNAEVVAPVAPIRPGDVAVLPEDIGAAPEYPGPGTVASLSAPASSVSPSAVPEAEGGAGASELPHTGQNVSVARAGVPQRGQFMGTTANYPANAGGAQLNRFAIC